MALALLALALCGYGYQDEGDPFAEAWKQVAAEANQGRFDEASEAARALEPGLVEIERDLGPALAAPIARALEAHDAKALARELTRAAYCAVLLKLASSRREQLRDYYAAKYRVVAARDLYLELLAPALRRRDAESASDRHTRVLDGLARAQSALGRPGFLGRGVLAPDLAAFSAAEHDVATALRAAFPFAPEVKP